MAGYVSPIPVEIQPNYRRRIEGEAVMERLHLWPQPDGWHDSLQPGCLPGMRARAHMEGGVDPWDMK